MYSQIPFEAHSALQSVREPLKCVHATLHLPPQVIVTAKKSGPEAQKLKELMHRVAPAIIRGRLDQYLRSLKEEYSQGVILPRRTSEQLPAPQQNASLTRDNRKPSPTPRSSSPASRPSGTSYVNFIITPK